MSVGRREKYAKNQNGRERKEFVRRPYRHGEAVKSLRELKKKGNE